MDIKKQILSLLQENARYSAGDIASMLNAEVTAVAGAIEELEKAGVIVKYSAIINTEALEDRDIEALIEVKVAPQKLKGFDAYAEDLYSFTEVKSLYLMSGGFDLAIFVKVKHITDISSFIAEKLSVIEGIVSVQTHFILKKYKIEGQIAVPSKDNRQILQA